MYSIIYILDAGLISFPEIHIKITTNDIINKDKLSYISKLEMWK